MSKRVLLVSTASALALATLITAVVKAEGQAPGTAAPSGASSASGLRTPWGEPDLQGLWTSEPEWACHSSGPGNLASARR